MQQPRINGQQARWLVYLTLYDFIIYYRPGLLNLADRLSRRPNYMAMAQKKPSLLQRDLLAGRLAGSDLPGRAQEIPGLAQADLLPDSKLCNIAKCQLCEIASTRLGDIPAFLLEARLCNTVYTSLGNRGSPRTYSDLPKAELCDTARATRRVNAPSPLVDSKGQWALDEGAVGLRTPIATVQVLCTSPRAEDSEAGHLLELVRLQAVTRKEAKKATQGESPLVTETVPGLLDQILQSQGTDPLCTRLKKELRTTSQNGHLNQGISREGYTLNQQGLLCYKGRTVVPAQKALIQELLYLYHDDQFAGHWGIDKTKELLERKFY